VETNLPHTPYSMSCYSVLTSCEVASNFSRYDGIRYGYRPEEKKAINSTHNQSFETLLKQTRDYGFGNVVKSRIASGNYFLLKE
jgi:aspartyl-tRNA(Asn)/glutamyl-tRNA(Gln) amidotransferase subunit A